MHRLRVVHVITKLELGGAQQNTLYTVSHLNRDLFEPHLMVGSGGILDHDASALEGVAVHFCPSLVREIRPAADWAALREMRSLFRELKPDIVHTHSSKAGILGRFAAHSEHVPVIIHTYHGFGFHRYQNPVGLRFYVEVERRACRRSHHLIFVSQANLDWATQLGLTSSRGTSLIRSGVQTGPLLHAHRDDNRRAGLGIPAGGTAVGMIACLKPQKDPLTFVETADLVTQRISDAYFFLIGDGELRDQVLERASRMKYPEKFRLLGWRRDIPEVMACLDLTVLTSLWEGLPRVIPEATIAGVPVVASDIEGNREIVVEGKNGALASPRNAASFAEKITEALQDHWTVQPEFSEKVLQEFDIDRMVSLQEELYLRLRN